jgi:hypothetical protein
MGTRFRVALLAHAAMKHGSKIGITAIYRWYWLEIHHKRHMIGP